MGTHKYETSVELDYYFKSCNNLENFVSYYNQLNEIIATNPRTILEIGVGNGLVYNLLKHNGYNVVSADINKKVKPDYVADVLNLSLFKSQRFDTVCAFEVLEHLPFTDFEKALSELSRVSKKYVILSLPIRKVGIEFCLWLPKVHSIYCYLDLPIPIKHKGVQSDNDYHYWEVNKVGYSKKSIEQTISKKFNILKSYRPKFNKHHLFLVLKKRQC